MSLASLLRAPARRGPSSSPPLSPATVEPLEGRRLMAVHVWGTPTGGSVTEGGTMQVSINGHIDSPNPGISSMMVNYSVGGTATPGDDFDGSASGTVELTWAPMYPGGPLHVIGGGVLQLPVNTDEFLEDDETAVITLLPGTGYTLTHPDNSPAAANEKVFNFTLQQGAVTLHPNTTSFSMARPATAEALTTIYVDVMSGTQKQTNASLTDEIIVSPEGPNVISPGVQLSNNNGTISVKVTAHPNTTVGTYVLRLKYNEFVFVDITIEITQ